MLRRYVGEFMLLPKAKRKSVKIPLGLIEVQTGSYPGEDDIIRIDDDLTEFLKASRGRMMALGAVLEPVAA
jgi:hypothetical protein